MITIDDLADAIEQYSNDKIALRQCVDGCEYDAGYYCSNQYRDVEKSKEKLDTVLKQYIAQTVAVIMQEITA